MAGDDDVGLEALDQVEVFQPLLALVFRDFARERMRLGEENVAAVDSFNRGGSRQGSCTFTFAHALRDDFNTLAFQHDDIVGHRLKLNALGAHVHLADDFRPVVDLIVELGVDHVVAIGGRGST